MQLLPGGSPFQLAREKRFEEDRKRAPLRNLSLIEKLVRCPQLPGRNDVLRLDLTEACNKPCPSGSFGDKDSRRSYHRVDHVVASKRELLDRSRNSGANQCLVELDLCLRKRGFCTGFLGRQEGGKLCLDGLLVGRQRHRACRPSAVICNRSTSRTETSALRRKNSCLVASSSRACWYAPCAC
jgi:hypothetical protein